MSTYRTLDGAVRTDFSYSRNGTYRRPEPSDHPYRRKARTDRTDLRGKVCPSCGLTRSMMNLCDCNS